MSDILFLAHRIPYPPDRGDKMRSWNILRHLGRFATVHLATLVDHPEDREHLPALREAMGGSLGEALAEPINRSRFAWATRAIARREPVTVAAFYSQALDSFVARILAERAIGTIYAFSVQMAQYVPAETRAGFVMDFVDFDSAKYADYANVGRLHHRIAYRREAQKLLAMEKSVAARADLGLFVSEAEADLFRSQAAPPGSDIRALPNGIDLDHYDPETAFERLPDMGPLLVFTGQMNYRPNVAAVVSFAETVLPRIRARRPDVRFAIVGREPASAVQKLAGDGVIVTGSVPHVRPWLAAAGVVVAPLDIARGVQNKVLEAMAMARPVVASPGAFEGIDAQPGRDLLVADGAAAQAEAVLTLLDDPAKAGAMGAAARRRMIEAYGWEAQLAPLAGMLGLDHRKAAA